MANDKSKIVGKSTTDIDNKTCNVLLDDAKHIIESSRKQGATTSRNRKTKDVVLFTAK